MSINEKKLNVFCENCGTTYSINSSKIPQGKTVRGKCKCGHKILINNNNKSDLEPAKKLSSKTEKRPESIKSVKKSKSKKVRPKTKKRGRLRFVGLVILVVAIIGGWFISSLQFKDISIISNIKDRAITQSFDGPAEVIANPFYADIVSSNESIKLKIRKLFNEKKFESLNQELEKFQKNTEVNILAENYLYDAYDSFNINDLSLEQIFNEWINFSPNSYQPYIARASYYCYLGWESRGYKWASETKAVQFEEMNDYFEKSISDNNHAISLYKQSMIPFSRLLSIFTAQGEKNERKNILQEALSINPASYKIREHFLNCITPRWGGSYKQMDDFAENSKTYATKNPKMVLLKGVAYIDAGDMKYLIDMYGKAIDLYSRALSFGDNPVAFYKRGKAYNRRKNYIKSLNDFNSAIGLNNEDGDYYYWRACTYVEFKQYAKAKDDILMAYSLKPGDKKIIEYIEWLAYKYYKIARGDIDNSEYDLALNNVNIAIDLDQNNISYYLLLDWILAKRKDWDQIISNWDQFIARNPDNSRAYVERGGAYYHKGDMYSAVNNAKIAADMGNPEGKEAYEKFKHLVQ